MKQKYVKKYEIYEKCDESEATFFIQGEGGYRHVAIIIDNTVVMCKGKNAIRTIYMPRREAKETIKNAEMNVRHLPLEYSLPKDLIDNINRI